MNLETIISEAKKGKQIAQNQLIDLFWKRVYHYVLAKIQDDEESEDITIETFTKVFNKLKLYNPDFDFSTWVISIAHNTMIDHLRKSKHFKVSIDDEEFRLRYDLLEDIPSPEESLILQQDNDHLLKAIAQLPTHYQKVIELRYLEDKTYKEIAAELDLTLANVKVRILRAKQLLTDNLR
ncbi:RNA polymerase sigma factor [Vaginella massiliensis]|uniref:RNA polymerase sigma factor n=1 Tax=Vaginella massiliensis TaxID=1816680 RepID=UPI000837CBF2|nr:sigma-70 family RNA polymerase sigma factor [Vaginella massiliensis]